MKCETHKNSTLHPLLSVVIHLIHQIIELHKRAKENGQTEMFLNFNAISKKNNISVLLEIGTSIIDLFITN